MSRVSKLVAPLFASAVAFACATSTTGTTGPGDAGTDAPAIDPDAQADSGPPPKTCVDFPGIKIVRGSPAPTAPDDKDCDPADPASASTCHFGKCAGWTDPGDGSTHGKCIATCTEMNKNPGQVCFPGSICRAFPTSAYCIPTELPLCGVDGGAPRGDGGCFNRNTPCTYDSDCCSQSCNNTTTTAKCD